MQQNLKNAELEDLLRITFDKKLKSNKDCSFLVKSPLRYPGGKSRAALKIINDYIPQGLSTLCSPFVGGGSIELGLASRGTKIYAYDAFPPLVNFWQILINNPVLLAKEVRKYINITPLTFYNLQKTISKLKNKLEIAAAFFVLNRCSFSGTTLSGGMSPGHPRFNLNSIDRIEKFQVGNFQVKLADFKKSIPKHSNDFLYCDPPYLIAQKLYGKKGDKHIDFNHQALAKILKSREGWVLSYNDCKEIRELYKEHHIITPSWSYGMNNSKKSNELLIFSKDYRKIS